MIKRILALLLATTLFVLVGVACANDTGTPSGGDTPAASTPSGGDSPSGGDTPSTEDRTFEGVEITASLFMADPFYSGWLTEFALFEELTGIKVHLDASPWENMAQNQALELASGSGGYDVVYLHPSWWRQLAAEGYLTPINDYTTQAERDMFIPSLLDAWAFDDGIIYGLPDWTACILLAYRTDLFAQKGLTPPTSFNEIVQYAEAFTGDGMYGITMPGLNTGSPAGTFVTALLANDGWVIDDNNNPTMDTPQAIETLEFFGKLAPFTPPGLASAHWHEVTTNACSGNVAMALMFTALICDLDDPTLSQTVGLWDYVPFRNKSNAVAIDGWIWSVAANSQHQEAASMLVKHMAGAEAQTRFSRVTNGTAGATQEYWDNPEVANILPYFNALNTALAENVKNMPDWITWSVEMDLLERSLQRMYNGEMTAAEVSSAVQEEMLNQRR